MPPRRREPPRRRRTKEIPRWRKAATSPRARGGVPRRHRAPQPVQPLAWTQMSGRQARQLARDPVAQMQMQMAAAGMAAMAQATATAAPAAARKLKRRSWRFRRHVQPFAWLVLLVIAGAVLHAVPHALLWGVVSGVAVPGLMVMAAVQKRKDGRHVFTRWTRRFVAAQALATAWWLPVVALAGLRTVAVWVVLSGLPFLGLWVRQYRWRPADAEPEKVPAADDFATFAALCAEQKWRAKLGAAEHLDGGGRSYPVQCDGVKTVMKKILAAPDNVAGAWHSTTSQVYVERDTYGVTSRGRLTILPDSSLTGARYWDGQGMDTRTGLVTTGRFADGTDVHEKWYEPRFGCYHDLDSGTTGSGKTELLNLKVFIALATGWFVPVILDPQEGQSLPFWRDRCIYASGEEGVGRRLRGLYAAFQDRSSVLATWRWDDGGVSMPGMPFFDYELLEGQFKIPLIILDEAHLVLKDNTKIQRQITADVVNMARLIRKAGGKMVLATQLPSLVDMGGSQALRAMLRGGNVWSGRTADKVSGGMLGLVKDPSEIPKFFQDGSKTAGLGYTDGPDFRPDAPMRNSMAGKEHILSPPPVPVLDDRFLEVMDKAMKNAVSPTATVAPVTGKTAAVKSPIPRPGALGYKLGPLDPPAALLEGTEDVLADDAPDGKRCVDAVRQVLTDSAVPLERGEIIKWVGDVSKSWDREKPWSLKMIGNVLRELLAAGEIEQPEGKGNAYQRVAGS